MRRNLIRKLKAGEAIFDGIIGYEETVIPQVQNAILSRHDMLFLGLRGQAVGGALARLRAAWLDRTVRTPEDLQGLAQELAKRGRVAHTRSASPRKPRSSAE